MVYKYQLCNAIKGNIGCYINKIVFTQISLYLVGGGGTPIYSVLRSLSLVKMKVKKQPSKRVGGQKSKRLLAGQESTSHFM